MEIGEIVGRKIKEFRRQHGITQLDFAMDTYMSSAYVSKFECGRVSNPTQRTLNHIAKSLGITMEELIHIDLPEAGKLPMTGQARTSAERLYTDYLRFCAKYDTLPLWRQRQICNVLRELLNDSKE